MSHIMFDLDIIKGQNLIFYFKRHFKNLKGREQLFLLCIIYTLNNKRLLLCARIVQTYVVQPLLSFTDLLQTCYKHC